MAVLKGASNRSREGHMSYVVLGLKEGLLGMFIPKSHMERIASGGAIHIVVLNTLVQSFLGRCPKTNPCELGPKSTILY